MTGEAKDFLRNKAGTNYLGIEQADDGSRVYSPDNPNGVQVCAADLWSLPGFNKLVL